MKKKKNEKSGFNLNFVNSSKTLDLSLIKFFLLKDRQPLTSPQCAEGELYYPGITAYWFFDLELL